VLPSLLTLAILAPALLLCMDHLAKKSLRTTHVFVGSRPAGAAAICPDGPLTRLPSRPAFPR
jgi:hypothetical protein